MVDFRSRAGRRLCFAFAQDAAFDSIIYGRPTSTPEKRTALCTPEQLTGHESKQRKGASQSPSSAAARPDNTIAATFLLEARFVSCGFVSCRLGRGKQHSRSAVGGVGVVCTLGDVPREDLRILDDEVAAVRADVEAVAVLQIIVTCLHTLYGATS